MVMGLGGRFVVGWKLITSQIQAKTQDSTEPALPALGGAAVQEAFSPPRHNLLDNQDVRSSPNTEELEHQPNEQQRDNHHIAMEGSPRRVTTM